LATINGRTTGTYTSDDRDLMLYGTYSEGFPDLRFLLVQLKIKPLEDRLQNGIRHGGISGTQNDQIIRITDQPGLPLFCRTRSKARCSTSLPSDVVLLSLFLKR
jgi:hypothetical protein